MKLQNTVLNSFTHTQLRNTHHKYVGICIDKPMFELQGVFQCRGNHVLKGAISKKKEYAPVGSIFFPLRIASRVASFSYFFPY